VAIDADAGVRNLDENRVHLSTLARRRHRDAAQAKVRKTAEKLLISHVSHLPPFLRVSSCLIWAILSHSLMMPVNGAAAFTGEILAIPNHPINIHSVCTLDPVSILINI
jgi:hypothetical protein